MRRRYALRGALVSCAIVFGAVAIFVFDRWKHFDGQCGGLIQELSARRPCSFLEDWQLWLIFYTFLFWPVVLAVLVVPPLIGWIIDLRRRPQYPR